MWGNYSCLCVFFDDDGKSFALFPALFFPVLGLSSLFWALFPSAFPLFWGLLLPLTGISALVLGFTMAFKRIARFFAWL